VLLVEQEFCPSAKWRIGGQMTSTTTHHEEAVNRS
jgi:hypothetical protein